MIPTESQAYRDQVNLADTEQILGRVYGLGRGFIAGFVLIATTRRIIGADVGGRIVRLWVAIVLGVAAWLTISILAIPYLLRLHPAGPVLIFPGLLGILLLAGKIAMLSRVRPRTIDLSRDLVSRIEYYKPGIITRKSIFNIKSKEGSNLRFWSAGAGSYSQAGRLLQEFCTCTQPYIPAIEGGTRLIVREDLLLFLILAILLSGIVISLLLI